MPFTVLRAVSTLFDEETRAGLYPPPPSAARAASILEDCVERLLELAVVVAMDASAIAELFESVVLEAL